MRRNQPDRFSGFHRALFTAYWADGRDIGSRGVVLALAESSGVPAAGIERVLDERAMSDHVDQSTSSAVRIGVDGTPAWLINRRLLVPGAQPRETFDRLVERLQPGPAAPPPGRPGEPG